MKITIRPAMPEDCAAVCTLLLDICALHNEMRPDLFRAGSLKYSPERFAEVLQNPETPVFVAECDGEFAGYLFCKFVNRSGHPVLNDYKTLYIDDICVCSGLRGEGVGGALMEYAHKLAVDSSCFNIELNVWEQNTSAFGFYTSLGYKTQRRQMELIIKE